MSKSPEDVSREWIDRTFVHDWDVQTLRERQRSLAALIREQRKEARKECYDAIEAVDDAGLKGLSFHGLRGTSAMMLAEAGCSDAEIQSITGHVTAAMAAYYRRQADKQKTAEAAILKLERKQAEV